MIPGIDFLKRIYIFQDLTSREIDLVTRIITPHKFSAGEIVMEEGVVGDSMYIIAEGEVQVYKALTMKFGDDDFRETEKTLSVLRADDYVVIGEMSLITEEERSATITALTGATLYRINREDFLELGRSNPELGFKVTLRLAELVSKRLKKSDDDIVRLTTALSISLS
ncbi:MAG: cyclic nucleotide-binding domain-containing protein [Thermodesulfobacteriota bacterium]|nr:cyclic nucleotide-binding domain-containing protein [Thermodesulfobacteriota bacterium]